jgi:hypothetical protein
MNKFRCCCLFDITATGVTGHFKSSRIPFRDRAGQMITDDATWNRSRNQQRNLETLTQLISLRTQVDNLTTPERKDGTWEFEFTTDVADVYGTVNDPVSVLRSDADGVPMITNLDNGETMATSLITTGADQNVWFESINISPG